MAQEPPSNQLPITPTLTEKTLKAVKSVKEMRMQGKDYVICKYYLLSEGFNDHEANEIWHLSKQMLTSKEKAMVAGAKSIYRGVFFIGGIMSVASYIVLIKFSNIIVATVFALIFMRYSRFAHLIKVSGIAEEGIKSMNPFKEKDPLEVRWFDYGVIFGFIVFFGLAYIYPDGVFGELLDSFINEYMYIEQIITGNSVGAGIFGGTP
ncbi:hypothetical protein HY989_00380 [Candidatus Micrarchaeota archaeon]|nr:hypothetical protein [Candidatus Micrarchaeota archaeon]